MGCHFLLQDMKVKSESEVAQSCLSLSDPMDCSLPGSYSPWKSRNCCHVNRYNLIYCQEFTGKILIYWQEYAEELYKKDLHDTNNHDGVITHLEPDILESEVKWVLGSITMNKASGGDGIPAELFQILKEYAMKVLHSICQQIWRTQQWPQNWRRSVFIPVPKKGNAKECSNYSTIALISHASKVVLKILQARLQQYMNPELPYVQAGFRKGTGTEIKLPTSIGSLKKQEGSRKTATSALLTTPKPLTV